MPAILNDVYIHRVAMFIFVQLAEVSKLRHGIIQEMQTVCTAAIKSAA